MISIFSNRDYQQLYFEYYNYILLIHVSSTFWNMHRLNRKTEHDWRRTISCLKCVLSLVSLAQDHRDREWTDGRRSRQGPMTGWSWTLAAFRGSFAVPRGTIYYRGSSRHGQSRFPPSRKRMEKGVRVGYTLGGRSKIYTRNVRGLFTRRKGDSI